jgi:hypothetical protein
MLARDGKKGGAAGDAALGRAFEAQRAKVLAWLERDAGPRFALLRVRHEELLREPARVAADVARFLGGGLDEAAMARCVDPSLHRQRSGGGGGSLA